jgi:hypothetical protein
MYCCIRCCETGVGSMRWITLAMYTDHLLVPVQFGRLAAVPDRVCVRSSPCGGLPWRPGGSSPLPPPGQHGQPGGCQLLGSGPARAAKGRLFSGKPGQPGGSAHSGQEAGGWQGVVLPIPACKRSSFIPSQTLPERNQRCCPSFRSAATGVGGPGGGGRASGTAGRALCLTAARAAAFPWRSAATAATLSLRAGGRWVAGREARQAGPLGLVLCCFCSPRPRSSSSRPGAGGVPARQAAPNA